MDNFILQEKMSLFYAVGISLANLGIYCNPEHFTFKRYRVLAVLLWVKSDLVIDEQNPLVPEKF